MYRIQIRSDYGAWRDYSFALLDVDAILMTESLIKRGYVTRIKVNGYKYVLHLIAGHVTLVSA